MSKSTIKNNKRERIKKLIDYLDHKTVDLQHKINDIILRRKINEIDDEIRSEVYAIIEGVNKGKNSSVSREELEWAINFKRTEIEYYTEEDKENYPGEEIALLKAENKLITMKINELKEKKKALYDAKDEDEDEEKLRGEIFKLDKEIFNLNEEKKNKNNEKADLIKTLENAIKSERNAGKRKTKRKIRRKRKSRGKRKRQTKNKILK